MISIVITIDTLIMTNVINSITILMMIDALVGSPYTDPGATATDNADGNITTRLSTFGLGAVDTTAPNNASNPYLITYDVSDAAGNAAVQGLRQIMVACRSPTRLCSASDGSLYCSTSTGLCVQLATGGGAAAGEPPVIQLVGQAVLGVSLGSSYLACPTPQPTNVLCDRSDCGFMIDLCAVAANFCGLCAIAPGWCLGRDGADQVHPNGFVCP